MVLMPFGEYYFYKQYTTVGDDMTSFQTFCLFYGCLMYTAMILLNMFWYYLILKRLKQLLTKKKDNNFEEDNGTTEIHNM